MLMKKTTETAEPDLISTIVQWEPFFFELHLL